MTGQVEAHLKDYLWVSVAQYMQWLTVNCDLYDFNQNDIWSFKIVAPGGIPALLSKKTRTLDRLQSNVRVVEEFAEEAELSDERLGLVNSLVHNMKLYITVVEGHLTSLENMAQSQPRLIELEYNPIDDDEVPF